MWNLEFEAPKGARVCRYGWAVTTMDGLGDGVWHEDSTGLWTTNPTGSYSSHVHGIRTIKAFKRYLKNHPELKEHRVVWVNKYADLDVYATWSDD